jgi:hypothetical protein
MRTQVLSLLVLVSSAGISSVGCGGSEDVVPVGPSHTIVCGVSRTPATVATGEAISSIASDGTDVYWADQAGGIHSVPVTGGTPKTLATVSGVTNAGAQILVDESSVYFAGGPDVVSVPKSGGAVVTLASNQNAGSIAATGGDIFWTDLFQGVGPSGSVNRVATGGGTVTTLASKLDVPIMLAVDTNRAFWVDLGSGDVKSVPLGGGAVSVLASSDGNIGGVASDGSYVYWSSSNGVEASCGLCPPPKPPSLGASTISRVPLSGGKPTVIAKGYNAVGMAIDANYAYWGDLYKNTVMAAPLAGGDAITLATDASPEIGPVVDACAAYWVDRNVIHRVGLPN